MHIQSSPRSLKDLRRAASPLLQLTFLTPLRQLPAFVKILLAASSPLRSGTITVEAVVFPPKHLEALLSSHSLPLECNAGLSITAAGLEEAEALLTAALGDWLDFYFRPDPSRFLLYADHDEYTTVFAARKGPLSRLETSLTDAGFQKVSGWQRRL
jgi:hypothetical protein